jgi:ATP-binding cassette subfamily F protein uup
LSTPIFYIKSGSLSFGSKLIFEDLEFYLHKGDKICLVGRNGCGKSSLLKTITGQYELDIGEIYKAPSVNISYLTQDLPKSSEISVLEYILKNIKLEDLEEYKYKSEMILDALELSKDKNMDSLSGGQLRRADLAKALTLSPEILLLDEPTNHLDIKSIEWLEQFIINYSGAIICISHDRKFLSNVTNKIWWLDKSSLRKSDQGFSNFDKWQDQIIEYEENQLRKLDKKLAEENLWRQQGVTARRKRNQKRLASLKALRVKHREFESHIRQSKQKLKLELEENQKKSKFIIEAEDISFAYNGKNIIKDFSIRIKKGEKIGIVGPNGTGKSTLVKLLIGELKPESGKIRFGSSIDLTYFDQYRSSLNPEDSLVKYLCPNGGDTVFLKNREMHVAGYLKQFLFDPKNLHSKISTLSGGEKNRLLLAKSLINPGNFMVLDEPTNDLDMDTLDLLLETLLDYQGTLLVVSHDRDFLDKLATKTLVFNNLDEIVSITGGYEDYINYISNKKTNNTIQQEKEKKSKTETSISNKESAKKDKISYKFLHLHTSLPKEIDILEKEIEKIEALLSNSDLYSSNPNKFQELSEELQKKNSDLSNKLLKWIEIDEMILNHNS